MIRLVYLRKKVLGSLSPLALPPTLPAFSNFPLLSECSCRAQVALGEAHVGRLGAPFEIQMGQSREEARGKDA